MQHIGEAAVRWQAEWTAATSSGRCCSRCCMSRAVCSCAPADGQPLGCITWAPARGCNLSFPIEASNKTGSKATCLHHGHLLLQQMVEHDDLAFQLQPRVVAAAARRSSSRQGDV